MAITLNGTTGITTPDITSTAGFDSADLTGDIAAARITTALNATGSAPIYACRAWVNFDGVGTVAIRASGNVSSITDNGTGSYTVNFINAMPDVNYSTSGLIQRDDSNTTNTGFIRRANNNSLHPVSSTRIIIQNPNLDNVDVEYVAVQIFR